MKSLKLSALVALLAAFNFAPATAATVTECGTDVCFTYDNATMYGSANIIGNNIFFLPDNFKAEALNDAGVVTANETLNIQVTTLGNYKITGFALAEQGDYKLTGENATVDVSGQLGVTSNTQNEPPLNFFPYRDTEIFTAGDLSVKGGVLTEWNAGAAIDLADTAGWEMDTDVTVTIENLLSASTLELGEQAFVEKKIGAIGLEVVPIPGAIFLFPSALGALAWMRRRRTA